MEAIKKFYSEKAISIATYIGGPLAAGYLIQKNFETLEQPDKARKSLIIGIISTIVLFAGIFAIPEVIIDKIPKFLIPAVYTGIIFFIVNRIQGETLKNHKESNGEFYSGWKAAGIGAIALVIIFAGIFLTAFIAGDFSNTQVDFDAALYEKEAAEFEKNERTALAVFNVMETQTPDYLIKEFEKGNVLWQENKEIINGLNSFENIPQELLDINKRLLIYCDLRVELNNLFIKAVKEDTDEYASEAERIGMEINQTLGNLN